MPHLQAGQKLTAADLNEIAHKGIQLLDEQVLTSDTAEVTFTDIDQTLRSLWIFTSGGITGTAIRDMNIQFNGDTGATSYSRFWWVHVGDGATAFNHSGGLSAMTFGRAGNDRLTSQLTGYIPGYSATDREKSFIASFTALNGTAATSFQMGQATGQWHSTAAITSIRIFQPVGELLLAGSIFSLYGLGN